MGYTKSIFQSSTDFSFYRTVLNNRPFNTLRYLGFVCFMISLFSYAQVGTDYTLAVDKHLNNLGNRLSGIEISSGKVIANEAFKAQSFTTGQAQIVIAPHKTSEPEMPETTITQITLTPDSLKIKDKGNNTQTLSLSAIGNFVINNKTVKKIRIYAACIFFFFFVNLSTIITFVIKIIKAFIVSDLIYLLFFKKKIPKLPASSRFNIGAYAIVPSALIEIFASTNPGLIPYIPYISLAMFCAFIFGAYKSVMPEEQAQDTGLIL